MTSEQNDCQRDVICRNKENSEAFWRFMRSAKQNTWNVNFPKNQDVWLASRYGETEGASRTWREPRNLRASIEINVLPSET